MPPRAPRSFWQHCRVWFRRFRIGVWLLVLAVVGAGLYLNQIGLPAFIKRPLLEQLRQRGVQIEFTRLRLLWYRGIVAENVRFGSAQGPSEPALTARQAELDLDWRAALRGRLQIQSVGLQAGRFEWPIADSNAPPRALTLNDLRARLRLLSDDAWVLEEFRARFAGANLFLSGTMTNASAIRDWPFLRPPAPDTEGAQVERPAPGTARRRLLQLAETLERISFAEPPELRLFITGDARDLRTFSLRGTLAAPDADTPWGRVSGGLLNVRLFAATDDTPSRAEVMLEAAEAQTPWAEARQLVLDLKLDPVAGQTNLVVGSVLVTSALVQTRWATATNAEFDAQWIHSITNPIPLSGRGELRATAASTRWASGRNASLAVSLAAATNALPLSADAAGWTYLQPYHLTWRVGLSDLKSEKLVAEQLACAGTWLAPNLAITNLHAELHRGELDAQAQLDVVSREASFNLTSSFDVQQIGTLLTEKARRWLGKYSWVEPPRVRGRGCVVLPAWTNREPDWRGEVWPTLRLAGEFAVTNGAYLGLAADWAHSHVTYTNLLWSLPDLEVGRPDGQLRAAHQASDRTKDYHWRIHSTLDLRALRPLLTTNLQRGFDLVTFTTPPVIDGEVWGRFYAYDRIGCRAQVAASNLTFKGTSVSALTTTLAYTNQLLEFFEPRIWRGTQHLRGAGVAVNFATQRVHLTNAYSTDDPMVVARAIGPKTAKALEPYQFAKAPVVHLNGTVPLRGNAGSDLRVQVEGGPFHWWKFNVPRISGTVFWRGQIVTLTNIAAAFYGGTSRGWGVFDASAEPGTDFQFALTAADANLHELMADIHSPTNQLEGTLNGSLTVTHANSDDWRSWNGYGDFQLREGLIWAIPIFGVLSPALDGIAPGLGSSRVSQGTAGYIITNGVVFSDDFEMRAPTMRLQYQGAVNLEWHVNATVRAEPLRDTWVVGPLVSLALWPVSKMLEFKVTGTLGQPKAEPLYIPKLFQVPFHPFRSLKELFSTSPSSTNAPPEQPGP
jgi:hypothetical protein